jgi:hypothetical protein
MGRSIWVLLLLATALVAVPASALADDFRGDDFRSDDFRAAQDDDDERRGDREFLLGVGCTRINFDGDNVLIDDRDGVRFDPVFSFAPLDAVRQLRLGAAVGLSIALDDTQGAIISRGGELIVVSGSDASLILAEPELRLSWRQDFGREGNQFFLEGGVGGGGVFAWLDTGDGDDDGPEDEDFEASDGTFMGRVFARFGMQVTGGLAGIEASYMQGGSLHFADGVEGDIGEAYIGIFGALKF